MIRMMKKNRGQTLVSLLFFMVTAITVTSAAVIMVILNSQATSEFQTGVVAYQTAESGAENGVLRLLRNPNYTGENLTLNGGTSLIKVSGPASSLTVTSIATIGATSRTLQVQTNYINNILTITSWKEVF